MPNRQQHQNHPSLAPAPLLTVTLSVRALPLPARSNIRVSHSYIHCMCHVILLNCVNVLTCYWKIKLKSTLLRLSLSSAVNKSAYDVHWLTSSSPLLVSQSGHPTALKSVKQLYMLYIQVNSVAWHVDASLVEEAAEATIEHGTVSFVAMKQLYILPLEKELKDLPAVFKGCFRGSGMLGS